MPDYSVITCVSRPEVYQSCLLDSINQCRHKHAIEIIPIINNNNQYSAAAALNFGIDAAKSDVLIFVHQDVRLLFDWFDTLRELLDNIEEDWGILGSAGISLEYGRGDVGKWGGALHTDTVAVGSVWDTDEGVPNPPYWDGIKGLTKVHCADECLLVMNRKTGLRFDLGFTGFHFYGVDICLQSRSAAYPVYCAHLPIIHYGKYSASFVGDQKYWVYLRRLHHKWRTRFPELLGTHMHWSTRRDVLPNNEELFVPEITSYISVALESDGTHPVLVKAMGLGKVKLQTDHGQGFFQQ